MTYTQFTWEERYQIYALKKEGHTHSEIANVLGRSPFIISRELQTRDCLTMVFADTRFTLIRKVERKTVQGSDKPLTSCSSASETGDNHHIGR